MSFDHEGNFFSKFRLRIRKLEVKKRSYLNFHEKWLFRFGSRAISIENRILGITFDRMVETQ